MRVAGTVDTEKGGNFEIETKRMGPSLPLLPVSKHGCLLDEDGIQYSYVPRIRYCVKTLGRFF